MRARNLKPGFFKNENLAECEPLARILFEGLWCFADREGRFEWRPKLIKVEVLPYDTCDVEALLHQLCKAKLIIRYDVEGTLYGFIPKFLKHQKPHIREAESAIPAPENSTQSTTQTQAEPIQDDNKAQPRHDLGSAKEGARHSQDALNPESPLLNEESPSPINTSSNQTTESLYSEDFEKWWAKYPKKTGKEYAFQCWNDPKKRKRRPNLDECLMKLDEQIISDEWTKEDGKFVPNPSTYINQGRWFDEVKKPHPLKGKVSETTIRNIENLNRWEQQEVDRERSANV